MNTVAHTPASSNPIAIFISWIISLFSFLGSFFVEEHIWLQNIALLVTIIAGLFAIASSIRHSLHKNGLHYPED